METEPTEAENEKLSEGSLENIGYLPPAGTSYDIPFWIAIAAVVFALFARRIPWVGALAGIASIALLHVCKVPRKHLKFPRLTVALSALAIVCCGLLSTYNPQPGFIRLSVDAPSWRQSYGDVLVDVTGTTDSGKHVKESVSVSPGTDRILDDLETGDYVFTVQDSSLEQGEELFEPAQGQYSCSLELEKNLQV